MTLSTMVLAVAAGAALTLGGPATGAAVTVSGDRPEVTSVEICDRFHPRPGCADVGWPDAVGIPPAHAPVAPTDASVPWPPFPPIDVKLVGPFATQQLCSMVRGHDAGAATPCVLLRPDFLPGRPAGWYYGRH